MGKMCENITVQRLVHRPSAQKREAEYTLTLNE